MQKARFLTNKAGPNHVRQAHSLMVHTIWLWPGAPEIIFAEGSKAGEKRHFVLIILRNMTSQLTFCDLQIALISNVHVCCLIILIEVCCTEGAKAPDCDGRYADNHHAVAQLNSASVHGMKYLHSVVGLSLTGNYADDGNDVCFLSSIMRGYFLRYLVN